MLELERGLALKRIFHFDIVKKQAKVRPCGNRLEKDFGPPRPNQVSGETENGSAGEQPFEG
ncbi:MAG: hypothetical protein HZB77_00125 [Chloroflexi bacterium]|nr:hypothetical protein [Chloroflexota bacterium]